MNSQCQIKDDDEILEEEKQRYNFRRFTPEELNKKNSPFEKTGLSSFKKKEYPFLFQKKKPFIKDTTSISLDDIIEKVKDLNMNNVDLSGNEFIFNGKVYTPTTPPYPPWDISGNDASNNASNNAVGLNNIEKMNLDE
jgi:hypothetical protein